MGCNSSKLDALPAVALCRHRLRLISDALRHRHALARAHSSYSLSLLSVSSALHRFLHSHLPLLQSQSQSQSECISPFHSSTASPTLAVHHARHQPPPPNSFYFQPSEPVYSYPPAPAPVPVPVPQMYTPSPPTTPPPPPPAAAYGWDFLDPFRTYDGFYPVYRPVYTPSRSSREVREEEGIPDLEEDDDDLEEHCCEPPSDHRHRGFYQQPEIGVDEGGEDEGSSVEDNAGEQTLDLKFDRGVSEAVEEIMVQFDRASKSVDELSSILQLGEIPQQQKNVGFAGDFFQVREMETGSLSSTLQKLYIWEKKLYEEVRAEEKMRVLLDRYCKRLKRLDKTGAEAQKVDSTQKTIRKLSARIRVAIQVVQSISNKINKVRNEELWPQICEVIQGVMRMWAVMLECHQTQSQAVFAAKNLDSISFGCDGQHNYDHIEATKELELEMLKWVSSFSAWINAQKNYVKALNGWLLKCIQNEPRITSDGIATFSPGRLGAPPVFIICNDWSQAMDRISEKEVIDAIKVFTANVQHLREQQTFEQHHITMANKEMNGELKITERDEPEFHKAIQMRGKKSSTHPWHIAHHKNTVQESNLQLTLRNIFEAMENFAATSMKAYEQLYIRSEELRLARGNAKVP
ncbi:protein ALTERED PHOSPHATE STARVATION RESPONSE 1-like [Dioscorea cayenensis subsp. rotundata]|uniref:Protein ALTERED PHOSPHATE STARVATION RESPONSE 1-like n=1 Tax=Dioscorea cayennensis subsp. rotundata TaxID=55577 RepID=A0AB40B3C7_DIOCR|nr:protein ALTERED PHOSPHATE STARVATION RESPONSE 1-like [Dioscorea cayenensis subsp. rotundata]